MSDGKTWTAADLIAVAQSYDKTAQSCRDRDGSRYSDYRRLAFTARRWARSKQRREDVEEEINEGREVALV